ncbi:MAG: acetylornithine deacetylase [bacterium]
MLREIIALNSISSSLASIDQGNRDVINHLANWLEGLGFDVEIMPLDDPRKANLIATLGSGPGGLVLSGHTDTVPCDENLWQQDPFSLQQRDGKLFGLGTTDMKGFFPLVIEAAKQFVHQPLKEPLIVLATADEESSMAGAIALAKAGRPKARAALIGEPTGLKPIRLHKGILVETLTIRGRSGHSSDPSLGVNAMEPMTRALNTLLALRDELKATHNNPMFKISYPTMNLGCIHGGNNANRICGDCELAFEIRPLPGMDIHQLHRMVEKRILESVGDDDVEVTLDHYGLQPYEARADSEMVAVCEKLAGHSAESVSFATEAPYLQALGMDVVIMGPGDIDQAHQPNEFIREDRLNPMVNFLTRLIAQCCLDNGSHAQN